MRRFFLSALCLSVLLSRSAIGVAASLSITTASPLLTGYVGSSYSQTFAATGGSGAGYTWSLTKNAVLPAGLTLSSAGVLSGKPSAATTSSFSITVTDSAKTAVSKTFSLSVKAGVSITSPATLPEGYQSTAYPSTSLVATGGAGTGFAWSWAAAPGSSLPAGLSLSAAGVISGTPSGFGTSSVVITVKDSAQNTASRTYAISVVQKLTITTASTLPQGLINQFYSKQLAARGGSGAYSWAVSGNAGGLAGYSLTLTSAGVLQGTPKISGPVSFGVRVTDAKGHTATGTFGLTINPALALPAASPNPLPSGMVNKAYTGSIVATGGLGPKFTWAVNSLGISQAGLSVTLKDGLSATTMDDNTLKITGMPTTAMTVSFSAQVWDSSGHTAGPVTYNIVINNAQSVSGRISMANGCGNNYSIPPMKVSINTNPAQTTTTDSKGNYTFPSIPPGTYTITPSITGPSSLFSPVSITNVVVNNSPKINLNFTALLGYTVSGTVKYTGTKSGPIYVSLNPQDCGGDSFAVSIPGPGPFTIHGVFPAKYYLEAWMDTAGFGGPHNSDPGGFNGNNIIPSGGLTAKTITISDPPSYNITKGPQLNAISPMDSGVFINFSALTGSNPNGVRVEMPTSYVLQWSTDPNFTNPAPSSQTFKAVGPNGTGLWFLYSGMSGMTGSLNNGTSYYFRAAGVIAGTRGPWSVYGSPSPTAVKIGAPTAGYNVSGAVTFSGTPTGPLVVGYFDESAGRGYATRIINPSSPQVFTVHVPAGSHYYFFGWLDQNKNGMIDPGDVSNTHDAGAVAVSVDGNLQNQNLTLGAINSVAVVQTQRWKQTWPGNSGTTVTNSGFNLSFGVGPANKLPIAATLTGGPRVIAPIDMGQCLECGSERFQLSLPVINGNPAVGDAYSLNLKYSDGTAETLTAKVTGVLPASALPNLVSPSGGGNSKTPSFDWDYPAANAGTYSYSFWICCDQNGIIWSVPGQNSDANGFTNSQITPPLQWGKDPTDSTNKPVDSGLNPGEQYTWSVQSQDQYGNTANARQNFAVQPAPLSLPAANPPTLPSAVVNAPYYGSIALSGGTSPYTWTVTGFPSDGLNWGWATNCACINITGTPNSITTAGHPISFRVTVKDGAGQTYGPVTYTIVVNSKQPVSLPSPTSNPLPPGMLGIPYSGALSASGGPGGNHYSFVVNGATIPTNNTFTTIPSGGGLQAQNSGGNMLFFSGTPSSTNTISLTVKVTDTTDSTDTATQTYSVPVSTGPSGANNSHLKGTYTCLIRGFNDQDGSRWASVVSMAANGSGEFTSGLWDTAGRDVPPGMSGTLTGTYVLGSDNNGLMKIVAVPTGGGMRQSMFAVALTGSTTPAQQFQLVENDDVGSSPSGQTGTGTCYLANTAAFTASTISGHSFAFAIQGENGNGIPKAYAGRMSALNGSLTNGYMDGMRTDQSGDNGGSFTGSYTAPNSTTGRFTLSVNGGTIAVYIIDVNRMFMMQTAGDSGLLAGEMRTQLNTSTYSVAGMKGHTVLYSQASEYDTSAHSVNGYDSMLMRGTADGQGSFSVEASYENESGTYTANKETGQSVAIAFDSSHLGRATFSPGTDSAFFYLFNTNQAFFLDLNGAQGYLQYGWLEPQTQTVFSNAAVAGNYMLAEIAPLNADSNGNAGQIAVNGSGAITGAISTAGTGEFVYNSPLSLTYAWDNSNTGSGAFLLSSPKGGTPSGCVVVSASRFICLLSDSEGKVLVMQK